MILRDLKHRIDDRSVIFVQKNSSEDPEFYSSLEESYYSLNEIERDVSVSLDLQNGILIRYKISDEVFKCKRN